MERKSNKAKGVLKLPNLNDHNAHLGFLTEGSGSMQLHNQILQSINITEFWKYLKMIYKIELKIAKRNDKLTCHNRKWQNLF